MFVCPECGGSQPLPGPCASDHSALAPVGDDALLGTTVGAYRGARLLGVGGIGSESNWVPARTRALPTPAGPAHGLRRTQPATRRTPRSSIERYVPLFFFLPKCVMNSPSTGTTKRAGLPPLPHPNQPRDDLAL